MPKRIIKRLLLCFTDGHLLLTLVLVAARQPLSAFEHLLAVVGDLFTAIPLSIPLAIPIGIYAPMIICTNVGDPADMLNQT